jgi:hypothetical protein
MRDWEKVGKLAGMKSEERTDIGELGGLLGSSEHAKERDEGLVRDTVDGDPKRIG